MRVIFFLMLHITNGIQTPLKASGCKRQSSHARVE